MKSAIYILTSLLGYATTVSAASPHVVAQRRLESGASLEIVKTASTTRPAAVSAESEAAAATTRSARTMQAASIDNYVVRIVDEGTERVLWEYERAVYKELSEPVHYRVLAVGLIENRLYIVSKEAYIIDVALISLDPKTKRGVFGGSKTIPRDNAEFDAMTAEVRIDPAGSDGVVVVNPNKNAAAQREVRLSSLFADLPRQK